MQGVKADAEQMRYLMQRLSDDERDVYLSRSALYDSTSFEWAGDARSHVAEARLVRRA